MIIIGLGGNLATRQHGPPQQTLVAALAALGEQGVGIVRCSPFYLSEPVPRSDQPWFVNAAAVVATALQPEPLLRQMLALERAFGRVPSPRNAARVLDLDLLDYDGRIIASRDLTLPHPRLHERRFVLAPLCDVAPEWRHPLSGLGATELLARIPPDQQVRRLQEPEAAERHGNCG